MCEHQILPVFYPTIFFSSLIDADVKLSSESLPCKLLYSRAVEHSRNFYTCVCNDGYSKTVRFIRCVAKNRKIKKRFVRTDCPSYQVIWWPFLERFGPHDIKLFPPRRNHRAWSFTSSVFFVQHAMAVNISFFFLTWYDVYTCTGGLFDLLRYTTAYHGCVYILYIHS